MSELEQHATDEASGNDRGIWPYDLTDPQPVVEVDEREALAQDEARRRFSDAVVTDGHREGFVMGAAWQATRGDEEWRAGWAACFALVRPIHDYVTGFEEPGDIDIENVRGALAAIAEVDLKGDISTARRSQPAPRTVSEWGRRIKDGSLGYSHMVGHVSSLWRTEAEARDSLEKDQEVVRREVTEWTEVTR